MKKKERDIGGVHKSSSRSSSGKTRIPNVSPYTGGDVSTELAPCCPQVKKKKKTNRETLICLSQTGTLSVVLR